MLTDIRIRASYIGMRRQIPLQALRDKGEHQMNLALKIIGISGGIAANLVMAGTMILIMLSPTQSVNVLYGAEFWIEIPLMILSSIVLTKWIWDELE